MRPVWRFSKDTLKDTLWCWVSFGVPLQILNGVSHFQSHCGQNGQHLLDLTSQTYLPSGCSLVAESESTPCLAQNGGTCNMSSAPLGPLSKAQRPQPQKPRLGNPIHRTTGYTYFKGEPLPTKMKPGCRRATSWGLSHLLPRAKSLGTARLGALQWGGRRKCHLRSCFAASEPKSSVGWVCRSTPPTALKGLFCMRTYAYIYIYTIYRSIPSGNRLAKSYNRPRT